MSTSLCSLLKTTEKIGVLESASEQISELIRACSISRVVFKVRGPKFVVLICGAVTEFVGGITHCNFSRLCPFLGLILAGNQKKLVIQVESKSISVKRPLVSFRNPHMRKIPQLSSIA